MKELKTWRDVVQALLDGGHVEFFSNASEKWKDVLYFPTFHSTELLDTPDKEYRIKPRTIMIGNMEVPEPVRDAREFNEGDIYYVTNPTRIGLCDRDRWDGELWDLAMLKRGRIHKTKEAAVLHAKALVKISGGSYD